MKYLGIDYGQKKTGLALGESEIGVAVPFDVIQGGEETLPQILQLIKSEGIEAFVVGLATPKDERQKGAQFARTNKFIETLKAATGLPVQIVDEQFTSTEARRVQKEYGSKVKEDALAAMLILQEYFDVCGRA